MKKEHNIRIDRSKLHPWLDQKLTVLLRKCAKKEIYLIITEGFRSKEYQDSLYAQGRTKPGKIVTNAKGSLISACWFRYCFICVSRRACFFSENWL